MSFIDAGSSAEQREDTGQQPNPGRAEPHPAAQPGAQERGAHQALQLSAGELRVLSASQIHPRYSISTALLLISSSQCLPFNVTQPLADFNTPVHNN